jgi:hypothetical protein
MNAMRRVSVNTGKLGKVADAVKEFAGDFRGALFSGRLLAEKRIASVEVCP